MEKKTNQMEVTQKVRKGQQSFLHGTCRLDNIQIAMKLHLDIPYGYRVTVRKRIVCKKLIKGQVTQKLRKGKQPFLYATRRFDLIHIAMKFHQNTLYGFLLTSRTIIVCKKTNLRAVTQKLRKGEQPFCMRHAVLTSYYSHYYEVSSKYSLRLPRIVYAGRRDGQPDNAITYVHFFQNGRI